MKWKRFGVVLVLIGGDTNASNSHLIFMGFAQNILQIIQQNFKYKLWEKNHKKI